MDCGYHKTKYLVINLLGVITKNTIDKRLHTVIIKS